MEIYIFEEILGAFGENWVWPRRGGAQGEKKNRQAPRWTKRKTYGIIQKQTMPQALGRSGTPGGGGRASGNMETARPAPGGLSGRAPKTREENRL